MPHGFQRTVGGDGWLACTVMTSASSWLAIPGLAAPIYALEDATLGPGGVIWDAAKVLAGVVVKLASTGELSPETCRAVELGAGVGLPGLVLAALGATVLLTDKPTFTSIQCSNASANGLLIGDERAAACGGSVAVQPFVFGGAPKKISKRTSFNLILASDILGCGDASAYPSLVSCALLHCFLVRKGHAAFFRSSNGSLAAQWLLFNLLV